MASENKEKKRKAIAPVTDAPQKLQKKSKKSLENEKDSTVSVQDLETVIARESEKSTKSKHKARKRAADFLSDTEDNATDGVGAPVSERAEAEMNEKSKEKKKKKGSHTKTEGSNVPDVRQTTKKDAETKTSKKSKKTPVLPSSNAPSMKSSAERQDTAASTRPTQKADNALETSLPAPSKSSNKHKKAQDKAAANAETLTVDGVNGVREKVATEALEPLTSKDSTSTSMQIEGQTTAEKELEDEWGSEDEEEDHGAALLAGFDSDGDDKVEDVGLEAGKPLPKLTKKTSKKVKEASQKGAGDGPGTVYVGRIPHGFYEQQMREYFSQFGTITKLRLSRNKRTGASKHFAFIEFESDEVAKIVANAMDNYLMFGHILKCKYAPQESLHPDTWKGANKRFRKVPYTMLEKRALEAPKTSKQWEKKNEREQKKREQKAQKMKELGYKFNLPVLKEPRDVLEQRKLQDEEEAKLVEATQEVPHVPTGASEPPKDLLKDEVSLKVEERKKNKKRNKPAQQQSVESVVEAAAAPETTKSTTEKPPPETGKRDKRKEKRAKSKEAKTQQTQLDAQLLGESGEKVNEADAPPKPERSIAIERESLPEKEGKTQTTADSLVKNGGEKRKREKSRDVNAREETAPEATQATPAPASADKAKKKRKSDNDAQPKSMLKKPSKAA